MKPEYVEDGNQMIVDMCRDKFVVDIGCIGMPIEGKELAGQYRKRYAVAKECYGLDMNAARIVLAIGQGVKEIYRVDICNWDEVDYFIRNYLGSNQADLITATDVIEHLPNVGKFLYNVKFMLKPDGKLVIGTPNIFFLSYLARKARGTLEVSHEHTCWFDEVTLRQALEFAGYKVERMFYYGESKTGEVWHLLDVCGGRLEPWMSKRVGAVASL